MKEIIEHHPIADAAGAAACGVDAQDDQALHIDIPVPLEKANVVFDIGHLVVDGDKPLVLGDAAYLVLNDDAYNANRHIQTGHPVKTGNPYRKLIAGLRKQGTQFERSS